MNDNVVVAEEKYAGKYVALRSFADREVVASGEDPVKVISAAKELGVTNPVIFHVPEDDVTFVY